MAKLKYKRLPKKPKAGASVQTMENWLAKKKEIKAHNEGIKKERELKKKLRKEISATSSSDVIPKVGAVRHHSTHRKTRKHTTKRRAKKRK